jgi:hypothetical protein
MLQLNVLRQRYFWCAKTSRCVLHRSASKDLSEHDDNSNKCRLCGKCVADFVLPFVLLPTVTNRVICLYLIEIAGLKETLWKGYGAGEGIRTLDPNLGKVVLYH